MDLQAAWHNDFQEANEELLQNALLLEAMLFYLRQGQSPHPPFSRRDVFQVLLRLSHCLTQAAFDLRLLEGRLERT